MVTLALLFKPSTTPLEISFWARKLHPESSQRQAVRSPRGRRGPSPNLP